MNNLKTTFFHILLILGMQDFNYVHSNCFDITIELTCCKYPDRSTLVTEWENNKESMLKYMEAVHLGAKGIVTNQTTGEPIANAAIKVTGNAKIVYTTERGEYWRLLKPGKLHEITVSAKGYITSQPISVNIDEKNLQILTPLEYGNFPVALLHESNVDKIEQDQKENKHKPIFERCDDYTPEVQEVILYKICQNSFRRNQMSLQFI